MVTDSEQQQTRYQALAQRYALPESPFREALMALLVKVDARIQASGQGQGEDVDHVISNGLYLVGKHLSQCVYTEGDESGYLATMLSALGDARRQYQQTCYQSDETEAVIRQAKSVLMSLMEPG